MESLFPAPPDYMSAFDGGDWNYYVSGHDPEELWVIDDPAELSYERLWMKPIKASEFEDYELDDPGDTVSRDPKTGRFAVRWCWAECRETSAGAQPFMGARYKA